MSELTVYGGVPLTAAEVKAQVNLIQDVMRTVMQENQHYGVIPGTGNKKTLLKPGAEKIMATFRLSADPDVEDLSTADAIRYRIKCRLSSFAGAFVGAGVGECSTDEEKYQWKAAVNSQEFEETPEDRRRVKWKKGYQNKPDYQVNQIRTSPADLANTVLKMAKKRALVDAVLTATAASDIFSQDYEDMSEDQKGEAEKPLVEPQEKPQVKATGTGDISPAQVGKVQACLKDLGITDDLEKHVKVSEIIGAPETIATFNELSKKQASLVITALEAAKAKKDTGKEPF